MYNALLFIHSYVRYIVLILLIVVIIASAMGLINKKTYSNSDNKLGLFLLIFTHLQFLVGIILYFVSPAVVFSGQAMKDSSTRYWLVEHGFGMIVAIALITAARVTSKKMADTQAKYRRLLIFNLIAFLIIVLTISFSGRDFISFR